MTKQNLYYYIDLPTDQALEVRSQLETTIWDIAQEENVATILRQANFQIILGQPAIEVGIAITVIVTYVGMKIIDKPVDEAIDWAWGQIILPRLRKKLGKKALVDSDELEG